MQTGDLARLHAKVYIADERRAIVSSANLTAGGLGLNHECGIHMQARPRVRAVIRGMHRFAGLGTVIDEVALNEYCRAALASKRLYQRHLAAVTRMDSPELRQAVERSEAVIRRAALGSGKPHPVFARSIRFLLRDQGPMTTVQLYPRIQAMHPNLCDDRVDRLIRGRSFGRKWWHAVRTAQQQLKKQGIISRNGDVWSIVV